jgi:hypothetical protein
MDNRLLAWNPATRRCHLAVPGCIALLKASELIRITAVPKRITAAAICLLVESRPDIRARGGGSYRELASQHKH